MPAWRDLSDDELAQRLRLRGLPRREVAKLVESRDEEWAIAWINHHLDGEHVG